MTNVQKSNEAMRLVYAKLDKPLMAYLAELHRLSIRKFAAIFGISKAHAEDILKHRVFPTLELAVRIARYWECSVDELFGWRVDDSGERRPLIIELPNGETKRLTVGNSGRSSLPLVTELLEKEEQE